MKKRLLIVAIVTLVIDQIIKYIVSNVIPNITVIPNFLKIVYAENDGISFSMLSGNRIFILSLSFILIILLISLLKKEYLKNDGGSIIKDISFGLLFGGIFGNLIDRIVRQVVIDYISIKIFKYNYPVFNFADISITIGVVMMIIYSIIDEKKKAKVK